MGLVADCTLAKGRHVWATLYQKLSVEKGSGFAGRSASSASGDSFAAASDAELLSSSNAGNYLT